MTREQAEHNICNLQEMIAHSPLNTIMHLPEMLVLADDAATLEEKLYQPLRVAVLGEVKAGKSTLLNALAGGVIAPSDVTETTACIMGSPTHPRDKDIFSIVIRAPKICLSRKSMPDLKAIARTLPIFNRSRKCIFNFLWMD